MNVNVLRILEDYGKWKKILDTYGLDSEKVARVSGEVTDGLKRMGFRIQIILEIWTNMVLKRTYAP